jgi:hypothetical protein
VILYRISWARFAIQEWFAVAFSLLSFLRSRQH